jgi:TIR domain
MSKPTIFFSHSSRDQKGLARLKDLFLVKTGSSIDVFLSSDGQSIPLGRNWVHKIQEALDRASLMVVFVTPSSLRSSWLFFESGFAYSKGIRVVPVGFLGVDLGTLPPPLGLLQGFNITSEAGLNNVIAVANEVFGHSHAEAFTADEFGDVCAAGPTHSTETFGDYGQAIDRVEIGIVLNLAPVDAVDRIAALFDQENIDYERPEGAGALDAYGLSVVAVGTGQKRLEIRIDPGIADLAFGIAERAIREVRAEGVAGTAIRLDFVKTVGSVEARHKVTGRLYGTDVKLAPKHDLVRGDIQFRVERPIYLIGRADAPRRGATTISMKLLCDRIPFEQVRDLLALLFERGVLYYEAEIPSYLEYD